VVLGCAYGGMLAWRMQKNGSCVPVYKTKGDPNISAWDSAGTVAPGVYSESACAPSFLKVENPARFLRGPDSSKVRAMTWAHLVFLNVRVLLLPTKLLADYSHGTVPLIDSLEDPRNIATLLTFISLLLITTFSLARLFACDQAPLLSFALLAVPFVPSSNLFFPVGFVVAERVLYLPSMGFVLLASLALHALLPSPRFTRVRRGIAMSVCLLYGGRTWVRNEDWRTRNDFYSAMVRDSPQNPKAHYGLGNIVVNDRNRRDVGVWHLQEATRLQPDYFDAYNDLGALFNREGKYEEAEDNFKMAVQIKPEHIHGLTNRGLNLLQKKDFEKAFLNFDTAVELFPDAGYLHENMGQALQGLGMEEDALAAYEAVIMLQPTEAKAYYNYGLLAGQQGKNEIAEMFFRNAVRLRPRWLDGLHNLGGCLINQDRHQEAVGYFLRVHKYNPAYPGVKESLEQLRDQGAFGG